jgi:hypothetical protein
LHVHEVINVLLSSIFFTMPYSARYLREFAGIGIAAVAA